MPLPLDVTARVAVARAVSDVDARAVVAFALAFALVVALVVVARARRVLARANVAAVRWRPKFLWRLYQRSARSLLRRVEDRFSRTARDAAAARDDARSAPSSARARSCTWEKRNWRGTCFEERR